MSEKFAGMAGAAGVVRSQNVISGEARSTGDDTHKREYGTVKNTTGTKTVISTASYKTVENEHDPLAFDESLLEDNIEVEVILSGENKTHLEAVNVTDADTDEGDGHDDRDDRDEETDETNDSDMSGNDVNGNDDNVTNSNCQHHHGDEDNDDNIDTSSDNESSLLDHEVQFINQQASLITPDHRRPLIPRLNFGSLSSHEHHQEESTKEAMMPNHPKVVKPAPITQSSLTTATAATTTAAAATSSPSMIIKKPQVSTPDRMVHVARRPPSRLAISRSTPNRSGGVTRPSSALQSRNKIGNSPTILTSSNNSIQSKISTTATSGGLIGGLRRNSSFNSHVTPPKVNSKSSFIHTLTSTKTHTATHTTTTPTRSPSSFLTRPGSAPLTRPIQDLSKFSSSLKANLEDQGMMMKDNGDLNLDNFNQFNQNQKIILTSPRSIEACLNMGISARELIYRPEEEFYRKGTSDDIAKMKWAHCEQKRKERLVSVRRERNRLKETEAGTEAERQRTVESSLLSTEGHTQSSMTDDTTMMDHTTHLTLDYSSLIAEETEEIARLNRSLQQSVQSFENLLNAEILKKKKEVEIQRRIEQSEKRDQQLKIEKENEAKKIEQARRQRYIESLELQEKLREREQMELEMKQQQFGAKEQSREQSVKSAVEKRQQYAEELRRQNEEKAKHAMVAEMAKKQKALELEQRMKQEEDKRREMTETRKKMFEESMRQRAMTKEEKIAAAKMKAEQQLKEKVNRILETQEDAEKRRRDMMERKREEEQLQKELEQRRESMKRTNIQRAQMEHQRRIEDIEQKRMMTEKISQKLLEQQQKSIEKRIEEQKLKNQDRLENIERLRRVDTFKKLLLMGNIEEKEVKIAEKKGVSRDGSSALFQKRLNSKLLIQKARKIIDSLSAEDLRDPANVKQLVLRQLESEGVPAKDLETLKMLYGHSMQQHYAMRSKSSMAMSPGTDHHPMNNRSGLSSTMSANPLFVVHERGDTHNNSNNNNSSSNNSTGASRSTSQQLPATPIATTGWTDTSFDTPPM